MKKQNSFTLMLVSILFLALYILGSINSVKADYDVKLSCFQCGKERYNKVLECKPYMKNEDKGEWGEGLCESTKRNEILCYEQYKNDTHGNTILERGCKRIDDLRGKPWSDGYCTETDSEGIFTCYCLKWNCNWGTKSPITTTTTTTTTTEMITKKMTITEETGRNKINGSVRLRQMSLGILFALPALLTLISDGSAFGI